MTFHRSRYGTVLTFLVLTAVIDVSHCHVTGPFGFGRIARDLGRKYCVDGYESACEPCARGAGNF